MQATSTPQSNPLDQLKDIHVPSGVDSWPLDWGWWLAGSLLIVIFVCLVWWFIKTHKYNQARREAIDCLNNISGTEPNWPSLVNATLKRTALSYFPVGDIAQLSGQSWVDFLVTRVDVATATEIDDGLRLLQSELYVSAPNQESFEQCHESTLLWLKKANVKYKPSSAEKNTHGGQYA